MKAIVEELKYQAPFLFMGQVQNTFICLHFGVKFSNNLAKREDRSSLSLALVAPLAIYNPEAFTFSNFEHYAVRVSLSFFT